MTYAIVAVIFAVLAIAVLARVARGQVVAVRSVEELLASAQAVDLEAFRNLTSSEDEQFLRSELPPASFRVVQRERMRAAAEYVERTAHNAALLMRVGEASRRSQDQRVAEAAQSMLDAALALRLLSIAALVTLRVRAQFPTARLSPALLADRYETLRMRVASLTRLEQPAMASRVVEAL